MEVDADQSAPVPESALSVSPCSDGPHPVPGGRNAQLQRRASKLVAVAATRVSDDEVIALIDSIRSASTAAQDAMESERFWAQAEAAAGWRALRSAEQRAAASAHEAAVDSDFDGVG